MDEITISITKKAVEIKLIAALLELLPDEEFVLKKRIEQ